MTLINQMIRKCLALPIDILIELIFQVLPQLARAEISSKASASVSLVPTMLRKNQAIKL
jgi:hypothetical protein